MSFGARLAAAFIGLVAAMALILAAVGFMSAESGATGQVDRFLRDRAAELIDDTRPRPAENDDRGENRGGNRGDRSEGRRNAVDADSVVQTLDDKGTPVGFVGLALPVDNEDRRLAGSGSGQTRLRTIETDQGPFRMITAAIPEGGAVQVARELTQTNSAVNLIQDQLTVTIPIVAVLAGLAGLLLARRITQPLRTLTATVDSVAVTGDLSIPVDVSGDDEVGRLAAGFDNLLRGLSRSRHQQHQLVQDAAHELRTPLTSVKANIDLLSTAHDLDEGTRREALRSVQNELRELTTLVNEIVEVATDRFTPQQFGSLDLAAVAADAVERFQNRRADRPVEIDLTPVQVRGDHESLVRAVGNLLANADKYSPPTERITVNVTAGRRVEVADRGPGIVPAERERVFDRFYRSDEARAQPGSGLGLAIVASIVDAHGGTVAIDENPGGGSIVSFTLPA